MCWHNIVVVVTASENSVQLIATMNNILGETVMHRLCGNVVSRSISLFQQECFNGTHEHKSMGATVHVFASIDDLGPDLTPEPWAQPYNV